MNYGKINNTMTLSGKRSTSSKLALITRRFLVPRAFVTAYALVHWRASISTRAEVELTPHLFLGRGTTVSSFTKMKATDGPLVTGQRCGFGTGCFISSGAGGIKMGDHVIVGPNVSMIASNYRYVQLDVPLEDQGHTSLGIVIGRNVWIGANCVIVDGAQIGDNSIVVAGSLVNRRFPANCIIQGNPAKVILKRSAG
jgi:carbonic anhydrase/acetyltransferase-like protein (isoleucine patch superfamily)